MSTPARRGRRPKLKVVGGELRPPRHRVCFGKHPVANVVEFFTEMEYEALESWERPEDGRAAWFPGVGYVTLTPTVTQEEAAEATAEYAEAIRFARMLRGQESL